MRPTRTAAVLGCGLTAFLVVAALITELAAAAIEFSVFVGIPAGLLAAALALVVAGRALGDRPTTPALALGAGVAAVGYTVLAGFALRYVASGVRATLTPAVIGWASLAVGLVVGVAVWITAGES